jgi:hypothetical protein
MTAANRSVLYLALGMTSAAVAVAVVFPPGVTTWIGRFPLTIELQEHEPIHRDSLAFATCWYGVTAEDALAGQGPIEWDYRAANILEDDRFVIQVTASGREGVWGTIDEYHHPPWLLVEYRLAAAPDEPLRRKCVAIPKGRGPRSLAIGLP